MLFLPCAQWSTVIDRYCKHGSTLTLCAVDISKAFDRVDHYALLNLFMDRKVSKYFINVMLSWFQCCVAAVRWGNAFSFWFTMSSSGRFTVTIVVLCEYGYPVI